MKMLTIALLAGSALTAALPAFARANDFDRGAYATGNHDDVGTRGRFDSGSRRPRYEVRHHHGDRHYADHQNHRGAGDGRSEHSRDRG